MNQIKHISYRLLPLFLCFFVSSIYGYVPQTSTCNPQSDVLFAEDPTSSQSFLMCKPYGPPEYGYWERHYCPNEMSFEFATQQCKTVSMPPNVIRQENDILHIAILNGSCANGEQCIGGTVCDLAKRRCLCPYGTVANLETLSCVQPQLPADNTLPPQQPAVSSQQQYANYYGHVQNTRYPAATSSATLSGTNSAQNMATSFNQFYRTLLQSIQQPHQRVITGQPYSTGSSYTSKPTGNPQSPGVPAGSSCAHGEHCEGGSVCVHPMNICLCPGDSVNRNGQCVSLTVTKTEEQARPQPEITKVGIGGRCNQYNTFCDFSADCVNGYCQCLAPKVEYAGKCVTPKESGPGEPCNGGQVCSRGSVCDPKMPVCVCPQGTDLSNGWCVPQQRPTPDTLANTNSVVQPNNIPAPYISGGGYMAPNPTTSNAQIQSASVGSQIIENKSTSEENSRTSVPLSPPMPIPSSLSRGQTGVGARCSLNTECMQGAYCNGNSQPPTCQCLSTHVNVNDRCEKRMFVLVFVMFVNRLYCDLVESSNEQQFIGTANRQIIVEANNDTIDQTTYILARAWSIFVAGQSQFE
ncbi:EB module domain-containing protein [Ditylenchus destructor]|uniref:EB module domain-containing protein n=1 Tax=Ditylenchus destructor TaxID=166010 RepID=A0AAD4R1A4_9BILA|nr:EB module domain-containing protein [Ditylenchus destructor]